MKTSKFLIACAILFIFIVPISSHAASTTSGMVDRILQDSELWGQCAIRLDASVSAECPANLISFDCQGNFNEVNQALSMLDTATLALATNRRLGIVYASEQVINGACVAKRVTVVR